MNTLAFPIDRGILELEARIGVRPGFFAALREEDDWSFVIKLHALFEAACTHLLLFHFKEPELSELFSHLELSNKTTGKIAFLSKLGLIQKENRRLLATLSELRNSLVHDVRHSQFSLSDMIAGLNPLELKQLAIAFSPFEAFIRQFPFDPKMNLGYKEDMSKHATVERMIERLKADPKLHVWIGSHSVLVSLVEMYGYSDYKQWVKAKEHLGGDDAL